MTIRAIFLGCAVLGSCCAGCSAGTPPQQQPTRTAPATGGTATAQLIVDNLVRSGQAVHNPVDTTAVDCPDAGCAQAVTSDRFQVMSFATTGAAQRYAGTHESRQVETIVVNFSPADPESERDALWSQITRMVR